MRKKILPKNQESCIINGGISMKYFKLSGSIRQRDPVSPYLFTLDLEVVFAVIKSNQNIHQLRTFEHDFVYLAYVEHTTFFIKNQADVIETLKAFGDFSKVSGLKPNKSKCEIA